MKRFLKRLEILGMIGLLFSGCSLGESIQKEKTEKEVTVHKEEKKIEAVKNVPVEEQKAIKALIDSYVQTINEKNFEQHMTLFSTKALGLEDTKAQKEAAFKNKNKKIELLDFRIRNFEDNHAVVETKEKEESVEKTVRYIVGKENGIWKVEEVRTIEKK